MPRTLTEVIAHIRAVSANPAIDTTLIQTEDLEALCAAAEGPREVKELGEDDLKEVATRVRGRMVQKFGQARVAEWIFANTALCTELTKQTYIAVREQIEREKRA
jgi:hypothetical protein